ncbi:MAG: glycosyltransferase family 2 protein [Gammaproteobacteria bacterium]|nr:glycosyltransferase family 2 protein [Gammaproteobacteria bacterium]MBV9622145.1 glycosyltransferase family 2 protein [Gammaproteobacteria bacterium]
MSRRGLATVLAPLGVCALLAGWIALSVANAQAIGFSIFLFAIANLIVYTDAIDFALRHYMRRRHTAAAEAAPGTPQGNVSIHLPSVLAPGGRVVPPAPFAIVASVYNLEDALEDFTEAFGRYRDRVWLISDGSTDNTVLRLRQAGWRCAEDGVNRGKPAALKRLIEQLPPHIQTVMVLDPDIRIRPVGAGSTLELEQYVSDFQQSGAAAVCPRIMIDPDGFLARFQAFEYALAFRVGRESLADFSITSGVSLYRRAALEGMLAEHSLSIYAEDFENAVLLLARGERIYYDGRLVVSTEGPGTVQRWFSQRVGWYHGLLKVYTERFRLILRISRRSPFAAYHYLFYVGGLSIVMHLVKILSALLLLGSLVAGLDALLLDQLLPTGNLTNPAYFITAVSGYLALGVIALFTCVPRSERAYSAPVVPLYLCYALVHIVPMTVGFANFFALKLLGRRLYQDHYERLVEHPVTEPETLGVLE